MNTAAIINSLQGHDAAFDLSIAERDITNMQMVLRAYGHDHTYDFSEEVINAAAVVEEADQGTPYTAVTVEIMRPDGTKETHDISLGGGPATHEMERDQALLTAYASGALHTIDAIRRAQSILVCSGYGLSNVCLLEVSPLKDMFS